MPSIAQPLAALSLAVPLAAAAADTLAPVVVTGTREPEPLTRTTADIVVIDAERIRSTAADSLEDLLRREAGLQIVRNGGPGQSVGFFVRGASTNSTLVLVDGVRVGSATLGQAELEAFPLAQIERIEVLRGPGSSLYGADAVGGVVRIETRRGEGPPRLGASGALGTYRSTRANAATSGAAGAFDYALAAGRESSRGVSAVRPGDVFGSHNPDRDGFIRRFADARLGFALAPGQRVGATALETRLSSKYDSADFAPPTFAPDPSADFRNRLTTRVVGVDYRGAWAPTWTTTGQASRTTDDLTSGGATRSRFVTRRDQATWQNAIAFAEGQQLVVAYEHLEERVDADAFPARLARRNDAGVLGGSGRIGAHSWQADVRRDVNSAYGGNTTGRIGYAFELADGIKLRALAGTTFRGPTFNDLYFPGFGVASIRAERGRSVEVGASWQGADANASATLWRNRVRDLIGYQPDPAACPPDPAYAFGCAANTSRARLQGATLSASTSVAGWTLRGHVDWLDARDADSGERLPRRAAHQETLAVDRQAGAWRVGASMLFVGARPDAGVVLGGYANVDVRASWRLAPSWQLEAKVQNVLDRRIEPARDYQGLGRQGWLGLRYESAGV